MTLRDALDAELSTAMQRRDRPVISALRTALAALDNAGAVPSDGTPGTASTGLSAHVAGSTPGLGVTEAARRTLSAEAQRALVARERVELLSHADRLTAVCRRDEADGVRRAADTLARALDQAPS